MERDASHLLLLAVAAGKPLSWNVMLDLLRVGMTSLGWRNRDGSPLGPYQAFDPAREPFETLRRLGALPTVPCPRMR